MRITANRGGEAYRVDERAAVARKKIMDEGQLRILVEMRPALEGFAGIPQETRLLFRGLCMLPNVDVEGMLLTSHRFLARGTRQVEGDHLTRSEAKSINRYSRVIISMSEGVRKNLIFALIDRASKRLQHISAVFWLLTGLRRVRLTRFESENFKDFVWRTLFAKTLPVSDFNLVTARNHRVCDIPWNVQHSIGLITRRVLRSPRYPTLQAGDFDIFIAQTPYPGQTSKNTAMVVRYHDALPMFMPHTIPEKSWHQAIHFNCLRSNVKSGAYFACVSDSTRGQLLQMFPAAESRSATIHNMVSHHYFAEDSPVTDVPEIVRSRLYEGHDVTPKFLSLREKDGFYRRHLHGSAFKYLLMVSTVEPRKNHLRLLAAWEALKRVVDPEFKLVVVGTLGWDNADVLRGFRPWIDRGELFMLNAVPAPDLRVLYRHAAATVCPSLGEGFDFSGVEAMRSGGFVVASDLAVHKEVYDKAAVYFDAYSTKSLFDVLKGSLFSNSAAPTRATFGKLGQQVSARYLPEKILPQWESFLRRVRDDRTLVNR